MSFTFRNFINWLYEGVEDKLATISLKNQNTNRKLQQIFEGDPTPNKMYVNWLVKLQLSGNLRFPEDKERSIEVLNSFNKIKITPNLNHIFPVDENNKLHSQKGPAIFDADYYTGDGFELWYNHGKLHRNNGPAVNGVRGKVWAKKGFK